MKKNNKNRMKIIYNPIIIYSDDFKERFDVIRKTEEGVIIGRLINDKFFDCGFIPKQNIKKIKE